MVQPQWFRWNGDDLELNVQVQTRSREEGLAEIVGGALKVRVNAPPVEGRANRRLLEVLARVFGVAKSRVHLTHGAESRRKRVRIEQPRRLPPALKSALEAPRQVDQS